MTVRFIPKIQKTPGKKGPTPFSLSRKTLSVPVSRFVLLSLPQTGGKKKKKKKKKETEAFMDQRMDDDGSMSPSSIPPTPPSPLPISVGPGNQKYQFSRSPTPSPPFSGPPSSQTSAEELPLLQEPSAPLAFSLDIKSPDEEVDSSNSCLKDLLEWLLRRCCTCLQN